MFEFAWPASPGEESDIYISFDATEWALLQDRIHATPGETISHSYHLLKAGPKSAFPLCQETLMSFVATRATLDPATPAAQDAMDPRSDARCWAMSA